MYIAPVESTANNGKQFLCIYAKRELNGRATPPRPPRSFPPELSERQTPKSHTSFSFQLQPRLEVERAANSLHETD